MSFIHYLLFLPFAILCSIYVRFKLNQIYSVKRKLSNFMYFFIIILIYSFSFAKLSFFTVFLFYLALFYLIFDFFFLIISRFKLNSIYKYLKIIYLKGITSFILAVIVTCYGIYNANNLIITYHDFSLNKDLLRSYKIALISDLHYKTGMDIKDLDFIVDSINKEEVDLFLMAGDIFDEATKPYYKQELYNKFKNIKTKYGVFLIEGNHDILTSEINYNFSKLGFTILKDEYVLINDDFYLVGRKDSNEKRLSLKNLVKSLDKSRAIVLLDHRPNDILKAKNFVDIQFSGHTHAGQLWPGGYFLMNGTYKIGDYTLYTSSGAGTWGVPIRTSKKNEIAIITINGKNK